MLAAELASMLLLAGLVGAYHLGRQEKEARERDMEMASEERARGEGLRSQEPTAITGREASR